LLSVPFALDETRHGVFLFEWPDDQVPALARQQAEGLAPILGRTLLDRRHGERAIWQRLVDAARAEARRLLGPMHTLRKLIVSGVLLLLAFFIIATGEHRVAASATLEGAVRRAVVAPFDGFVVEAGPRAGQEVRSGDSLATLDDRDLRLETQRWSSQEEQYRRQALDAEAQSNLAQIQIALAQTRQAAAQRELSESSLARARILAPFDALIVAGDLSQQLGGAVRKGQTLFELAPLDAYRIVFEVEEGDIAWLATGQRGSLVLAALTDQRLAFTVSLITPVATAREGRNFFRVEATLDEKLPQLRPGMEGIGKIVIGERRLIWIWTHRMMNWLRLQTWIWLGV
jgi:multidrug resistance efflux pump